MLKNRYFIFGIIVSVIILVVFGVWFFRGPTVSEADLVNNPKSFQTYYVGKEIVFRINGDYEKYVGSGWSVPEKSFVWTNDKDAYVNVYIKDAVDRKLQLNVSGRCIFDSVKDKYQTVTVFANNKELAVWDCGREESTYRVVLPESAVENGAIEIRFNIKSPFVPKPDTRTLGLLVKTMWFSDVSKSKTKTKIALWLKNKVFKTSENTENHEIKLRKVKKRCF